ncbi:uncharacterized protein LOC119361441 [Triticum dicoccoides]|uniref:uncharacterized protein LOC119361441 n=1 Tax=Triticum dicoccoides TaxID=85692 RepID=UPI0018904CAD|nr:uncharacterized protein LOC119361441 [Triticum dicoccoides]
MLLRAAPSSWRGRRSRSLAFGRRLAAWDGLGVIILRPVPEASRELGAACLSAGSAYGVVHIGCPQIRVIGVIHRAVGHELALRPCGPSSRWKKGILLKDKTKTRSFVGPEAGNSQEDDNGPVSSAFALLARGEGKSLADASPPETPPSAAGGPGEEDKEEEEEEEECCICRLPAEEDRPPRLHQDSSTSAGSQLHWLSTGQRPRCEHPAEDNNNLDCTAFECLGHQLVASRHVGMESYGGDLMLWLVTMLCQLCTFDDLL